MQKNRSAGQPAVVEFAIRNALATLAAGNAARALAMVRQCLKTAPGSPLALAALARVLMASDEPDAQAEAVPACEQAVAMDPTNPELRVELGRVKTLAGRLEDATSVYQEALVRWPQHAVLHHNLANVLQRCGQLTEAEKHYRSALLIAPKLAEAHFEYGRLLAAMGRRAEALVKYIDSLEVRPGLKPAFDTLVMALEAELPIESINALSQDAARPKDSVRALRVLVTAGSVQLDTERDILLYVAAMLARLLGQLADSEAVSDKLMRVGRSPRMRTEALFLKTLSQLDRGNVRDALEGLESLSALAKPGAERAKLAAMKALAQLLLGDVVTAGSTCRSGIAEAPELMECRILYAGTLQLHDGSLNAQAQRELARTWVGSALAVQPRIWSAQNVDPERKLKIAYLSGDLRRHSCAYFLMPLLRHHDTTQFELFAYQTNAMEDEVTAELRRHVPVWREVASTNDDQLVRQIADDGIDILVDMAGLTHGHRLGVLAAKVAPVQLGWLGFIGSTGLSTIDGRITDAIVDPTDDQFEGAERPIRLDHPYLCYEPPADAPAVRPPPMLRRGAPTYGSFNSLNKLSDACLDAWAELLAAQPAARLLVKCRSLADPYVRELLERRLTHRGIDIGRTSLLAWAQELTHHLDLYGEIDVALDTFPYNGVTTSCEASWMGVPVVSLVGRGPVSRQGLMLLTALGTPEQAETTVDGYVARCLALVADADDLAVRRAALRSRMKGSPLCDGASFARAMEQAYRQMWRSRCDGRN